MNQLTKENLAELIIYSDAIDDILSEYEFNQDMKFEFNKIHKSTKKIIKFAFGKEDPGELDEWKFEMRKFVDGKIKGNIKLKEV